MLDMAEHIRVEYVLRVVFAPDACHEEVRRGALAPPCPAHDAENHDSHQDDKDCEATTAGRHERCGVASSPGDYVGRSVAGDWSGSSWPMLGHLATGS